MKGIVCAALLVGMGGCRAALSPQSIASAQSADVQSEATLSHEVFSPVSYHYVEPGETLWRIARWYGLDVRALAAANRLSNAQHLDAGRRLLIPLPSEGNTFLWPMRGALKESSNSPGLRISGTPGTSARATRSGRVAMAAAALPGWGPTVILDHLDGYLSIYAGLEQIFVVPGALVRQGTPIGSLDARGLHFEIRYGNSPRNTLALLPGG